MSINIANNFHVGTDLPIETKMVVADLAARDAIPAVERFDGLFTWVVAEQKNYQLQGGILNTNWVEWQFGASPTPAREVWVDTAGSDAGTGTIGDPFLTWQHAVNVISPYLTTATSSCVIHVNTGTYFGNNFIMPNTAVGYLTVLGGDVGSPELTQLSGYIQHHNPGLILDVKGIRIVGATNQIDLKRGTLIYRYNLGVNATSTNIYVDQGGFLYLPQDDDGDVELDTNFAFSNTNIIVDGMSKVLIEQSPRLGSARAGMIIRGNSHLATLGSRVNIPTTAGAGYGVLVQDSTWYNSSRTDIDLDSAGSNSCILLQNSTYKTYANITYNVANAGNFFKLEQGSKIDDQYVATVNETNIGTTCLVDHGCQIATSNAYGTGATYNTPAATNMADDDRYLQASIWI